jgi:hypothetical protein
MGKPMLNIGIDNDYGLVFEGRSSLGHLISPSPVITPARIIFESEGELSAEKSSNVMGWRFREDSYDPVSRIRRGRFYEAQGGQPQQWTVPFHPIHRLRTGLDIARFDMQTFYGRTVHHQFIKGKAEQPLVILGVDDRFTIWTIINVEATSTGEDLVTLKARTSLGVLPKIDYEKIPERYRSHVRQCLDTFMNEVYRSAPISVIDRARDAATQILIAYFKLEGSAAKDLGELIKLLDGAERVIAASAARIINRLHSRPKPAEAEKRGMRPVREQDAELAAQCLGTLFCELDWADWT